GAVPPHRQGLLHGLRQPLFGSPHRDAGSHRSTRHGPPGSARRGLTQRDGSSQAQGRRRFRHRAAAVHIDHGAALEGLSGSMAAARPLAVLFACGLNSVRSPIAAVLFGQMFGRATYVGSAGVRKGELDPFAVAAMAEIGIDISRHKPVTFEELDEWEGLNFDLIVTLAPEAHHRALELTRVSGVEVEYWPTADPSAVEGSREQRLQAYRQVRDQLLARIRARFIRRGPGNE